jgi:hypothetical protein
MTEGDGKTARTTAETCTACALGLADWPSRRLADFSRRE